MYLSGIFMIDVTAGFFQRLHDGRGSAIAKNTITMTYESMRMMFWPLGAPLGVHQVEDDVIFLPVREQAPRRPTMTNELTENSNVQFWGFFRT